MVFDELTFPCFPALVDREERDDEAGDRVELCGSGQGEASESEQRGDAQQDADVRLRRIGQDRDA